jgi:hypothetical protein
MIRKENNKWVLYSKDGDKVLGTFDTEDEAKERERQIIAAKKAKMGDLPTVDMEGISILKPGTWIASDGKPTKITLADMKEAVANWARLSDRVRPVFKLQHLDPETHKKYTSLYAFGWLHNPRLEGDQLKVDIKKVPAKVASLIDAGALRHISAEIYTKQKPWYDAVKKDFVSNVITAAGVLGSDPPAVKTLDDMVALFKDGVEDALGGLPETLPEFDTEVYGVPVALVECRGESEETMPDITQADIDLAVKKAEDKVRAEFSEKLDESDEAKEAAQKERDAAKAKLAEADKAAFDAKTDLLIEAAVKDKKILPAHEDKYRKVCAALAEADAETAHEELETMFKDLPKLDIPGSDEKGKDVSDEKVRVGGDTDPTPGDVKFFSEANDIEIDGESYEIAQKIADCQKREGVDYETAFCEVTGATPMEYLQPLDPRRVRGDR